jgi:hypothetical protein
MCNKKELLLLVAAVYGQSHLYLQIRCGEFEGKNTLGMTLTITELRVLTMLP